MSEFGIGRVPADVDATDETVAQIEAAQLMEQLRRQGATQMEEYLLRDWHCSSTMDARTHEPLEAIMYDPPRQREACDGPLNLRIYRSGTAGSAVECERHWLQYHQARGSTVDEVLALIAADEAAEAPTDHTCVRCGASGAEWNSGAGNYLCVRHWDAY